jgi:alcohol dehydrogenase class IV
LNERVVADVVGEHITLPQEKVIYGAGSLGRLADEVHRLEGERVFIITGRSLAADTPVIGEVEAILGDRHAGTFSGIRQHAPESGIHEAVRRARQSRADVLVSVGGGSPIDATKAVARGLAEKGNGDYPPHIAIPTTLSAAEYSHVAGYKDEDSQEKTGFADRRATPRVVILEPELALHTPMWLWLSSGIRALDHAVETLYSPGYHPVSDVLALQAIADLFEFLPRCKDDPQSMEPRLACQLAAWMSYFSPASVGAHKGLSHVIGKRIGAAYNVAHGVTSCILLAHVMRYKALDQAANLAPVARRLGLLDEQSSDEEAALAAADAVSNLIRQMDLPVRLKEVDVPQAAFEQIAHSAANNGAPEEDIIRILQQAW